jgi:hypothetical protein
LRRVHDEGAAVLLVTTRADVADRLPGRRVRLEDGRIADPAAFAPPPAPEPEPAPEPPAGTEPLPEAAAPGGAP